MSKECRSSPVMHWSCDSASRLFSNDKICIKQTLSSSSWARLDINTMCFLTSSVGTWSIICGKLLVWNSLKLNALSQLPIASMARRFQGSGWRATSSERLGGDICVVRWILSPRRLFPSRCQSSHLLYLVSSCCAKTTAIKRWYLNFNRCIIK